MASDNGNITYGSTAVDPNKRPLQVRILGQVFPIETEDSEDFTRVANGEIHGDEQRIRIADGIGPDKERETLLHEVLHGISILMASELDERQIRTISNGLYAVLQENPQLVRFLTYGLGGGRWHAEE